ncbi:MAG: hypothetical protein U0K71_03550, partial [Paludibacteraceae bacterium]|nr:hypothetical protein [Paludibacteraceae bacterium]
MKIKLYILTLILLNLLTFSSTVNAQILEKDDTKTLSILPFNYIVNGSFDIITNNPLKKYFVNVNGAIRIDDNTIALKTKDQFYAQIKVEVDKGRLVLGGINETQGPGYHYNKRISISEGKLDFPVDINCWSVNRLSMDDKDITISIYDFNTDQLLEKKKYILKPDTFRGGPYPKLCYTNLAGEEVKFTYGKIGDDIDYSKPMKIVAEDIWDKSYKVCSCNVKSFNSMCEMGSNTTNGDTLTERQKN